MGSPAKLVPHPQIGAYLEEWVAYVAREGNAVSLTCLAERHARFERIHPFSDGNGRTGRLLLFAQALQAGLMAAPGTAMNVMAESSEGSSVMEFYIRKSVGTKAFLCISIFNTIISLSLFGYQLTEETSLHPLLILATYANSLEAIAILFFAMKIRRKEPPS